MAHEMPLQKAVLYERNTNNVTCQSRSGGFATRGARPASLGNRPTRWNIFPRWEPSVRFFCWPCMDEKRRHRRVTYGHSDQMFV